MTRIFMCGLVMVFVVLSSSNQVFSQKLDYFSLLRTPARILQDSEEFSEDLTDIQSAVDSIPFEDFLSIFENVLTERSNDLLGNNLGIIGPNFTVSERCNNDTGRFIAALTERQSWALSMLDAFGKPKPGIKTLALNWVGDYYECIETKVPVEQATGISHGYESFSGQYCTASIPFPPSAGVLASQQAGFGLRLGVCVPNSCTSDEMVFLVNSVLDDVNITNFKLRVSDAGSRCQNEHLEYDTKAIVAIVVGIIFAVLLVLGTVYDLMIIQLPKYMIEANEKDGVLNEDIENGSIKHVTSDEQSPLLGGNKTPLKMEPPEPSVCGKILLSFSAYSNGLKILSTKQPKGSLNCVHGIRFLSMTWVILGHSLAFGISILDNFATFLPHVLQGFGYQAITNATVSVDTFFAISGLLVAYLTLKELKKRDGKLNWVMFYFHRYWRLTPPFMFLMLIYVPLFPYITNGPFWPEHGLNANQCKNSWWTNLLYVNNLVWKKEPCMGWCWYLANDMQFYVLSPLMIVPLYYNKYIGMAVSGVFLLTTMITAGVISEQYDLQVGFVMAKPAIGPYGNETIGDKGTLDFSQQYYAQPWCRMGPYIIGILAGYYLYKTELKFRWNKLTVIIGWCVATASALAVVYGLYGAFHGHPLTRESSAFYNAVNRTVWGACVSWVVIACVGGYGGPVNVILSWKGLIPLSRLTYCAYLIHPIVIYAWYFGQKKTFYMTDSMFAFLFLSFLVASYMLAFILSLLFESPMMGLENVIFKRQKR